MKKFFLAFFIITLSVCVFAQTPDSFSYQAIVRNAAGIALSDHSVSFHLSILKGSASGSVAYGENQSKTTNQSGLVTLAIGNGTGKTGNFNTINWGTNTYYLKIEIDITGGGTYVDMGTIQLLSVPYALHAKTAETITGNITETDPLWTAAKGSYYTKTNLKTSGESELHFNNITDKPTTVSGYGIIDAFNGSWSSLSGKPVLKDVATSGNYNDLSSKPYLKVSLSGDTLRLSSSNWVIVPGVSAANAQTNNDIDGDGIINAQDNCPSISNPDQKDTDGDGIGDACEASVTDTDGDGVPDASDNCPLVANSNQQDIDGDGIGDACETSVIDTDGDGIPDASDNCPLVANSNQQDTDHNGIGDACETSVMDTDGDGVLDVSDNCPLVVNALQQDTNNDGIGDACDPSLKKVKLKNRKKPH